MRLVDLFFAFPFLVLVIAIIAMLGPSIFNMFVAIWITSWVAYARIMRAQTVVAKKQQYVLAARALGYGRLRVMFRHILPNTASAVIIFSMVDAVGNIILAASLGFLGLGAQPPSPEWGTMISDGQNYMLYVLVAGHHARPGRGVRRRRVQPDRRRARRPAAGRVTGERARRAAAHGPGPAQLPGHRPGRGPRGRRGVAHRARGRDPRHRGRERLRQDGHLPHDHGPDAGRQPARQRRGHLPPARRAEHPERPRSPSGRRCAAPSWR